MTAAGEKSLPSVLVTGAGGFIGRHLTRALLERGHPTTALDPHLPPAANGLRGIAASIADAGARLEALESIDTVFHLAACHLGVRTPPEEFERINVQAAAALARDSAAAGVRRFVHCSSVGVYGRIAHPPADEETPCHPNLVYERSKLAGEQAVLAAASETGLDTIVLRPAWVYGPGCPRTEKLFGAIGKGRFIVAGSGQSKRHCIYISDMVEAFLLAARIDAAVGKTIIIGDAAAVSIRQLVDEIARLTGARPPLRVPLVLFHAVASMAEIAFKPLGTEPPISRRTLEFFTSNTSFRIDRAREVLGFEPRFDLAAGLAETHAALCAEKGNA
ncbi:MAG: NAD-dependent epimerase/dehydratase family protein [Deltaproteobacteria bacterium]|jgi:nucleoside-diphosphate-sugar epimerase|nr:NAD-dependent epimerase/dehydratase family protein [Deltaproteobacteria bacterium]